MATQLVLGDLLAQGERAGLPHIDLESVGGVDAARRVVDGEAFDLVILAVDALARLAEAGHVEASTVTSLLLSQAAVGVPSGTEQPATSTDQVAFRDREGVRAALRRARRIGYSTGPSGSALVRLIDELGLGEEVGGRLVQARPGIPVARLLADGDVDLGFQQLSELVGQPGVRILGVMPPDCTIDTVFAGGIAATTTHREGANAVLAFLASDAAGPTKLAHSFTAPAPHVPTVN